MTLGIEIPGVPVNVPTSRSQAEQLLRQQAAQHGIPTSTQQLKRQVERRVEKEAGKIAKQVGGKLAKQVGIGEAQKLVQQTLKDMKIPGNIPVTLPRNLTVGAVKDAAVATGMKYAENAIQEETGIPIKLPRKLSVGELKRSITGLLPSDAGEAIELGLTIGAQYAASALTSLVAGAAIGSAIPGLGTVIGIGVALGVEAIKGAVKPQPFLKPCDTQITCPAFPALAPMDLIPWIATTQAPLQAALNRELARRRIPDCTGGTSECLSVYSTVGAEAFNIAKSTPQVLGLYQLQRLIPLYTRAAQTQPGSRSVSDSRAMLPFLQRRYGELQALVATANQVERLPAAQVAQLRWTLIKEMTNAAVQYQYDQNNETRQWLADLANFFHRLENKEKAQHAEMVRRAEEGQKIFRERTQTTAGQKKVILEQLQFRCGQDDQAACREYRRIAAGGALTPEQLKQFGIIPQRAPQPQRPAPRQAPMPQPAPPGLPPAVVKRVKLDCARLLRAWGAKLPPNVRRCLKPSDIQAVNQLCLQAYLYKQITPAQALQFASQVAANACARR